MKDEVIAEQKRQYEDLVAAERELFQQQLAQLNQVVTQQVTLFSWACQTKSLSLSFSNPKYLTKMRC